MHLSIAHVGFSSLKRVAGFANSLAAGARELILSLGQLVPSRAPSSGFR